MSHFIWDVLISLVSGAGAALAAFYLLGPYYLRRRIDEPFERRAAEFQNDLELKAESVRHDFQKRIHDFGLFTEKRHAKYADIYERLLIAASKARSLMGGFERRLTFQEANRADFESFLHDNIEMEGQIELLLSRWEEDRDAAVSEAWEYIEEMKKPLAQRTFDEARNAIVGSGIYLSRDVDEAVWEWLRVVRQILTIFLFDLPAEKLTELEKQDLASQERLRTLIQREIGGETTQSWDGGTDGTEKVQDKEPEPS